MENSPTLLALTASALAALAPKGQAQEAAPDAAQADYRFSFYREAALPASKVAQGDGKRYLISTHQFRLAQPFGDGNQLTANLAFETMSGASPWYVQPDSSGKPVQVMSGASISDQRTDLLLGLSRQSGQRTGTLSAGFSKEDDYQAANVGAQGEWQLADTVTTLSAGAGYSDDRLSPTVGATEVSTTSDRRHSATAFAGWSRVLGPLTVVQSSLSYTRHDGFLSDPYKSAWIDSIAGTVPDQRPDRRAQFTWGARLRRFFKNPGAALHADYRYYRDDWDVDAHTFDLQWHQRLGQTVRLVPGARYYSQSQASFYEPYYASARADGLASSDYRLSPYGALSLSLTASAEVGGWGLNLRLEDYSSDADWALGQADVENPGLVDFRVISFGLNRKF